MLAAQLAVATRQECKRVRDSTFLRSLECQQIALHECRGLPQDRKYISHRSIQCDGLVEAEGLCEMPLERVLCGYTFLIPVLISSSGLAPLVDRSQTVSSCSNALRLNGISPCLHRVSPLVQRTRATTFRRHTISQILLVPRRSKLVYRLQSRR